MEHRKVALVTGSNRGLGFETAKQDLCTLTRRFPGNQLVASGRLFYI